MKQKPGTRTCKHHHNDSLTNMQTTIYKSSERMKHEAHWDCCDCEIQMARTITVITDGTLRVEMFDVWSFAQHWLTVVTVVTVTSLFLPWPGVDWDISNGRAVPSSAELLTDCYRLSLSLSVPAWVSTCRLYSSGSTWRRHATDNTL